jgi:hypothetical protein
MPRRAAKVTQADIARAIRAAKEAGAHSVTIDSEWLIRIELAENTASNKLKRDLDETWTPSEALQRYLKRPKANEVALGGPWLSKQFQRLIRARFP